MCRGFKSLLRYQKSAPIPPNQRRDIPKNLAHDPAILTVVDDHTRDERAEPLEDVPVLDWIE